MERQSFLDIKHSFLDKIRSCQRVLNEPMADDTLLLLGRFENKLTLTELEACFINSTDLESLKANLDPIFAQRFERIRNTCNCYTQQPNNPVNQLCFEIASTISPIVKEESPIIKGLENIQANTGPYCLLMPTLAVFNDVFGENIHELNLNQIVISDDGRRFIPLQACFKRVATSDTGLFQHMVMLNSESKPALLTPSEIERVSHHSEQSLELDDAICALNKKRLWGDDLNAKLQGLANSLLSGGAHDLFGGGDEFTAGHNANEGIVAFKVYWDALPEARQAAILIEEPDLNDILGRLFRPDDADYRETSYCVEILAENLAPIIARYNQKPSLDRFNQAVLKTEEAFSHAVTDGHLIRFENKTPPRHILPLIFELNEEKQQALFKQAGCENALMYALRYDDEALLKFKLSDEWQKKIISETVDGDTSLIFAAKNNKKQAIKSLLAWGAKTDSVDKAQETALHLAAINGNLDIVNLLIDAGASLDAKDKWQCTPLHCAAHNDSLAVTWRLINQGADMQLRDCNGNNVFDIAIKKYPRLIMPILKQAVTLPLEKQQDLLSNVPGAPYPSVLFYLAIYDPSLLKGFFQQLPKKDDTSQIVQMLNGMDFDWHLQKLFVHYVNMKRKSVHHPKYESATKVAEVLLETCLVAKKRLFESSDTTYDKIQVFKNTIEAAVLVAKPTLEKHREWKKLIALFLLAVLAPPVGFALNQLGFFSTNSSYLMSKIQTGINKVTCADHHQDTGSPPPQDETASNPTKPN